MKILVPGLIKGSQFKRLREEGEKRGHEVRGCSSKSLVIRAETGLFKPSLEDARSLESFDLIYFVVSRRRWEWYTAALYLAQKGTVIVNRKVVEPDYNFYLTPAIDYLRQSEQSISFPKSVILFSRKALARSLADFKFPLVVKSARSRQGRLVYLAKSKDELLTIVGKLPNGAAWVLREFVPNDGDIRVLVLGYKALGAMKRTPREGDFRSNISQGGSGSPYELDKNSPVRRLAEEASRLTRTEVAGVDIVVHKETGKPYLLEVNPAPQFSGFEKATGVNAAEEIIKYFETLL